MPRRFVAYFPPQHLHWPARHDANHICFRLFRFLDTQRQPASADSGIIISRLTPNIIPTCAADSIDDILLIDTAHI